MPKRKLPSVALGALPSTRAGDPLSLEGMDSAVPEAMAISSQALSRWWSTLEHATNTIWVSLSHSPPVASENSRCSQHLPLVHSLNFPPGPVQPAYLMRCFDLQGVMNEDLEQLLMTRVYLELWPRERTGMKCQHCQACQNKNQAALRSSKRQKCNMCSCH